jgi:predicted DNA-binding transcriptional regulator YafY
MPITKDVYTRFRILDSFFSNQFKTYTIDNLLEELNDKLEEIHPRMRISLRQLRYDLAYMTGPDGWDIEFVDELDGKKKIFRYADPNFSIFHQPLNNGQLELITNVVRMLESYTDSTYMGEMADALNTLKMISDDSNKAEKTIGLDLLGNYKGREYKQPLHDAIRAPYALKMHYKSFASQEVTKGDFHPQFLKTYNNRWFLMGCWDQEKEKLTVLPLDRIIKFTPLQRPKYYQMGIDWENYFEDFIGVSKPFDGVKETIHLRFFNDRGKYVETKPLHSSQEPFVFFEEGISETKLHLIVTRELISSLLSFGRDLQVISPNELVNNMKEIASQMADNYK